MIFRMIFFNGFPLITDSENDKYADPGTITSFLLRFRKRISNYLQ